jgi:hypothetical protein
VRRDTREVEQLRRLAAAAPARPQTGPLPGAYPRALLPLLERQLEATVLELDPRELANVNTAADFGALTS